MPSGSSLVASSANNQRPGFPYGHPIENPLRSLGVDRQPGAEHVLVVDRARGYVRMTVTEGRTYAEDGYMVLDLNGRQHTWSPPLAVNNQEVLQNETFEAQYEWIHDVEDEITNVLDAPFDEEMYYDTEAQCYKGRKLSRRPNRNS